MRIVPTGHKYFRCKDIRIYLGSEFYGGSVGEVGLSVRYRTSDLRAVGLCKRYSMTVKTHQLLSELYAEPKSATTKFLALFYEAL